MVYGVNEKWGVSERGWGGIEWWCFREGGYE
jgi:hypothetical protein